MHHHTIQLGILPSIVSMSGNAAIGAVWNIPTLWRNIHCVMVDIFLQQTCRWGRHIHSQFLLLMVLEIVENQKFTIGNLVRV